MCTVYVHFRQRMEKQQQYEVMNKWPVIYKTTRDDAAKARVQFIFYPNEWSLFRLGHQEKSTETHVHKAHATFGQSGKKGQQLSQTTAPTRGMAMAHIPLDSP